MKINPKTYYDEIRPGFIAISDCKPETTQTWSSSTDIKTPVFEYDTEESINERLINHVEAILGKAVDQSCFMDMTTWFRQPGKKDKIAYIITKVKEG